MGKMARECRARLRKEQQRRTGYVRPSRAKPKTGWTLAELAQLLAMRERLLKRRLEMEIVPRPPFRSYGNRSCRNAERVRLDVELPASGPGVGRWTRVELGLGLELGIRDDTSPEIRALTARIRSLCR